MSEESLYRKTYKISPDYPWVVFIHGAGGSSSIWFKQVRDYRKHFNVLLIDLRGHGLSSRAASTGRKRYTFPEVAADILAVMDEEGIESAYFVGVSLGSILIRSIAELQPHRIDKMVFAGAVTRLNFTSRSLVFLGNVFKRVVPYIWLYRFFAWVVMPRNNHKEARKLFGREAKKLHQREFIRWFRLTRDVNPLLRFFEEKEIPVPTLYLMGGEDHLFLPPVRQLVAKHVYSTLHVIRGAGHVCNVEEPKEFNETSIAFLRGV